MDEERKKKVFEINELKVVKGKPVGVPVHMFAVGDLSEPKIMKVPKDVETKLYIQKTDD